MRSRRDFLATSGSALGGAWVSLQLPAIEAAARHARRAFRDGAPFQVLTAREAAVLEAMAAQIFPTDDTPGARETGVIHFLDRALETFAAGNLEPIRTGARELDAKGFAELPFDQQTASLQEIEQTPFFGMVRFLTVAGMFANPEYGGNRDGTGWRLLGFDMRPAYQPPFGSYDQAPQEDVR